jgi:hypothetical protein
MKGRRPNTSTAIMTPPRFPNISLLFSAFPRKLVEPCTTLELAHSRLVRDAFFHQSIKVRAAFNQLFDADVKGRWGLIVTAANY